MAHQFTRRLKWSPSGGGFVTVCGAQRLWSGVTVMVALLGAWSGPSGTPAQDRLPEIKSRHAEPCRITIVRVEVSHLFVPSPEEMNTPHARTRGWLDYYAIDWVDDGLDREYIVRKGNRSVHPAPWDPKYNRLVVKPRGEAAEFLKRLAEEFHVFEMGDVKYDGLAEHMTTFYSFSFKDSCGKQHRFSHMVKDDQYVNPTSRALVEAFDQFFGTSPPAAKLP